MVLVTYVPLCVTRLFRGLPGLWQRRPRLVRGWLMVMPALFPGRKTLEAVARWPPAAITAWRLRRVRKASYWHSPRLVDWWLEAALNVLPPPSDGDRSLVGDGRHTPKRGAHHPLAHKGRTSA